MANIAQLIKDQKALSEAACEAHRADNRKLYKRLSQESHDLSIRIMNLQAIAKRQR